VKIDFYVINLDNVDEDIWWSQVKEKHENPWTIWVSVISVLHSEKYSKKFNK